MQLNAQIIEAFSGTFLSPLYDSPKFTPEFHREVWGLYASEAPQVAVAAPRNSAKSTAFLHDFVLADTLFRVDEYVIIIGSSEEMAIEHLTDISGELHENEDLRREFGIKGFISDQKSDIIVECYDGHQFRIIARGGEQKIRGRKWHGKRPGLIVFDDMEDDEQVENKERRAKFRRWFFRAAKQALRDGGRIRGHGTILHEDSLLARLMRDKTWETRLYRAHSSYDEFTNILWPEKFPESRLRAIRQQFIEQGDPSGYSQEYLNDPFDNSERYLRTGDFLPMSLDDYDSDKVVCIAGDFAISKQDAANRTSFTVGGKDVNNILHFIDQRKGRWDSLEIIEEMFALQIRWNPAVFFVEDGAIWKSIAPMVYREMQVRDIWINIQARTPVKDKASRGRSLQRRMRASGVRFDKKADWYSDYEGELLRFTGYGEAVLDDQFDSSALLSLGFDDISQVVAEDLYDEDEMEFEQQARQVKYVGRSAVTGY